MVGLEEDGDVAADRERQELRAARVRLREVRDVVHLWCVVRSGGGEY